MTICKKHEQHEFSMYTAFINILNIEGYVNINRELILNSDNLGKYIPCWGLLKSKFVIVNTQKKPYNGLVKYAKTGIVKGRKKCMNTPLPNK